MDKKYNLKRSFTQDTLSPLSVSEYNELLLSIRNGDKQILSVKSIHSTDINAPASYRKTTGLPYYKALIKNHKTGDTNIAVLSHIQARNIIRLRRIYSKRYGIRKAQTSYKLSSVILNSSQRDPKPVKPKGEGNKKPKKAGDKS